MKRVLTLAMVLCLAVSMFTVAASANYSNDGYTKITKDGAANAGNYGTAAGPDDTTGTEIGKQEIPINVVTNSKGGIVHVYAVTISATELTFTWNNTANTIWNPEILDYETGAAGSWDNVSRTITINNYSDVGITVTPNNTTIDTSDANLEVTVDPAINIPSAYVEDGTNQMQSGTIDVSLTDAKPDGTYLKATPIATLTLTITRNDGI